MARTQNKVLIITIISSVSIIFVLITGVLYLGYKGISDFLRCEEKTLTVIESKYNTNIKAELIESNCGATNPYTYNLNLKNSKTNKVVKINKNPSSEPEDITFTGDESIKFKEADRIVSSQGGYTNTTLKEVKIKFVPESLDFSTK